MASGVAASGDVRAAWLHASAASSKPTRARVREFVTSATLALVCCSTPVSKRPFWPGLQPTRPQSCAYGPHRRALIVRSRRSPGVWLAGGGSAVTLSKVRSNPSPMAAPIPVGAGMRPGRAVSILGVSGSAAKESRHVPSQARQVPLRALRSVVPPVPASATPCADPSFQPSADL